MKQSPAPECRFCGHLGRELFRGGEWFRCEKGRFDVHGAPRYFAWSGVLRPNKTVAVAQKECSLFTVSGQVHFVSRQKKEVSDVTAPITPG